MLGVLALLLVGGTGAAVAQPGCVGDCEARDRVTAADLVRMIDIAAGGREVAECPAGDADEDGRVTADEIEQAIRGVFLTCLAEPPSYSTLGGELHDLIYASRILGRAQAAAILAALDELGLEDEEEIFALLALLLEQQGVAPGRIGAIVVYAERQNDVDCEECLRTCSGRCVQAPHGDCFCYERLPTDPARLVVLLLEHATDETAALEVRARPCATTLLHAGKNDSFSTANGIEPTSQGQGLLTLIQNNTGNPPANFDDTTSDRHFGHTFVLPQGRCLEAASLTFRARPIAFSSSANDAVHLGFVNPSGQFTGAHWAANYGTAVLGLPVLLPMSWLSGNYPGPAGATLVLNLASLPGGMNLLPDLDANRTLDLYSQDDTIIDYIDLVYRLCNCPPPTPTPTPTPSPTPVPTETPTPGPCMLAVCKQSIPASGASFAFSSAWPTLQGLTVDDGLCVLNTLPCGPLFNVFEVLQPSFALSNISCSFLFGSGGFSFPGGATGGFDPGDIEVLFHLNPGGFLECHFTNILHPTPTPTVTPTSPPTFTATATLSPTRTPTLPPSPTQMPTGTQTRTGTPTSTATATGSRTSTPTATPSRTATPTASRTPTRTATAPITPTCVPPPQGMVGWWPLDEAPGAVQVVDIGLPPPDHGVPKPAAVDPFPPNNDGPASVAGNLLGPPTDTAFFFYGPGNFVEVPHAGHLDLAASDLTIDAWMSPLPGPWSAGRDDLHVYPVVDKLDLVTNTGYAFYVEVETICATCPPPPQQPQPAGESSTTSMRLVLALGDGTALSIQRSTPFYAGSGLVFPFPMPSSLLSPPSPGWTHVAVVVDRAQNTLDFYVGGVHLGGTVTPPPALNSGVPLWLGGTRLYATIHAPGFTEFYLNEIEIFDVALPASDIQAIAGANGGKCKDTPTPTATVTATLTRPATRTPTVTPIPSVTWTPPPTPTRTPTLPPSSTPTHTPTPPCFGEVCVFKFNDADGDGVHDPGEAGLGGWTINFFDQSMNLVTSATTGVGGFSCFGIPAPAVYTALEIPQFGWTQTFPPPPGDHFFGVECGQLVDLAFGNTMGTPTPVPTATRTRTATVNPFPSE